MKKKLLLLIPLAIFLITLAFFIKDIIEIWPYIFSGDEFSSEVLLNEFGWKGVLYLVLIQACQMLLVFVPSEFIQVVAGATYGVFYGTLVCWGGLILGATIIYLIVNVFKFKVSSFDKDSDSGEIIRALHRQQKSSFYITLILFFLPAIPYGVICYFASGTKMNYFQYILACLIGVLPSVLLTSYVGIFAMNMIGKFLWPILIAFVAIMILFMWLVKKFTKRHLNKVLYGTPKPEIEKVLSLRKTKNPNSGIVKKFFKSMSWYFKRRNKVNCDNNILNFEPPYVALCAHPSKPDFIYTNIALGTKKVPNIVANRYYFNYSAIEGLLEKAGIIPKKLFTADVNCIKHIIKVVKEGNGITMMPEGRLSINGTNIDIPPGLGKLLKKLGVPVLGIIPHGAYFVGAKWAKSRHKGKVEIESKVILTPQQIAEMTEEEIETKCINELSYDEFEWLKTKDIEYKSKNLLKGIEGILYHCPHCHSEFTLKGHKNTITCSHCGTQTVMNNKFEFVTEVENGIKNIRDWFNYQVRLERENVQKEDFKLSCEVKAKTYNKYGKGFDVVGEGICILDKDGLHFDCVTDPQQSASISCENMQTLLFGCQEDFEVYIDNKFYYFIPVNDKKVCVKFGVCAEELHKLTIEKNKTK